MRLVALFALWCAGCGGFAGDNAIAACVSAKACGLVTRLEFCLNRVWQAHQPGTITTDPLAMHADCLAAAGSDCGAAVGCLAVANPFACSAPNSVNCAGSIAQDCFEGTVLEVDCAQLGAHCDGNLGLCTSDDRDCPGGNQSCDGDVAVICGVGREDCGAVGLHCIDVNGGVSCGKGSDCPPAGFEACEGDTFRWCDLGVQRDFDCRTHGYSACDNSGGCIP